MAKRSFWPRLQRYCWCLVYFVIHSMLTVATHKNIREATHNNNKLAWVLEYRRWHETSFSSICMRRKIEVIGCSSLSPSVNRQKLKIEPERLSNAVVHRQGTRWTAGGCFIINDFISLIHMYVYSRMLRIFCCRTVSWRVKWHECARSADLTLTWLA